jgi:pimeloyl-ACP methyl ester carboxylesterase
MHPGKNYHSEGENEKGASGRIPREAGKEVPYTPHNSPKEAMPDSIYKSKEGETKIRNLYGEALFSLAANHESRSIPTGLGETHVLAVGPEDSPPLLFLPGGNFLNPSCLEWFLPLSKTHRIYAPDIIGQPGRSAGTRPSSKGDGHAKWVEEVLDGLGLERVPFVGISYGAGISLRIAGYSPERVSRAVLVSPSGLVRGSIPRMLVEVVLPMAKYRLSPNEERLRRASRPLLTEEDEFLARQVGAVYRHVKLDSDLPRAATKEELSRFHSPTMVFAAEDDIFFPGEGVIKRAREIIPNLVFAEILEGSLHIPSRSAFAHINEEIEDFLGETHGP